MQLLKTSLPKGFFRANQGLLFDLVASRLKPAAGDLIFLRGPVQTDHFDDDALYYIFPENLYYYLTGISSDAGTYAVLNPADRTVAVFCKEFDPAANYWQKLKTPADYMKNFEIDSCAYEKELPDYLAKRVLSKTNKIYLYSGKNPYSGNPTLDPREVKAEVLKEYLVNADDFFEVACEARVRKTPAEIAVMKSAAELGVYVHQQVMKQVQPGMTEQAISNLFTSIRVSKGSGKPYHNIVCAGINGSYLHYSPSAKAKSEIGDLILIDSGCSIHGYSSDITRTYPVSGKFTAKQADLYNIVLAAQTEALSKIKAGVNWLEVHIAAEKVILKGLTDKGLIKGDLEELWTKRVSYYFMPHGVGHYIGLYTHDLPGLKEKENNWTPIPKLNLRVKRVLEPGMVFTVEPGLYFNRALLDSGYADVTISPYLNKDVIEEWRKEVGGIRIEDEVVVTESGYELLTVGLPKTVAEIEAFMKK